MGLQRYGTKVGNKVSRSNPAYLLIFYSIKKGDIYTRRKDTLWSIFLFFVSFLLFIEKGT